MAAPLDEELAKVADSMGIAFYQQFTLQEASLFLRCPLSELKTLVKKNEIQYIQVSKTEVQFFGFQLLQHLFSNIAGNTPIPSSPQQTNDDSQNRILRTKEVQQRVGLSRSTIWRLEQKGDFPTRVPLGIGSIGWLKSDIDTWLKTRK